MPYITPTTLPAGTICTELEIPDSQECVALVVGALYELTQSYNWEQQSGQSIQDTTALFATMFDTFAPIAGCSGGGSMGYVLQDEDTLSSDVSGYELTNLHQLGGRDMRIEWLIACTVGSEQNLEFTVNNLTSSIYRYISTRFTTTTNYTSTVSTIARLVDAIRRSQTPQHSYSLVTLDFPLWKDTDKFPTIRGHVTQSIQNGLFGCEIQSDTDIQSIQFSSGSGDIKAGSKIAVYTKGN